MSERMDVQRMLLQRGWTRAETSRAITKNGACWAVTNAMGTSFLDGPERGGEGGKFVAEFPANTPAQVIVAACEAAADTGEADHA